MAVAMVATPFEKGRLFANDYFGKRARLCLANTTANYPNATSTTAQWDAVELSGAGYSRFEWTIPAGSFNSTSNRWEAGVQLAAFGASAGGPGLTWNAVYLVLGSYNGGVVNWNTGVSFVLEEHPSVTLAAGNIMGYNVLLFSDGFLVTS